MFNRKYIILLTLIGASWITGLAANAKPGPDVPISANTGAGVYQMKGKRRKTVIKCITPGACSIKNAPKPKPSTKQASIAKFTNVTIKVVATTDKDLYDWHSEKVWRDAAH